MGTLGNGLPGQLRPATHTTPDAVAVQAELARQARLGVKAVAMEVSSHALDQGRVSGVSFHTAVFSNLTHEHLDYHGSMSAYAEAKGRLLRRPGLMHAVVNADDRLGRQLLREVGPRVMSVACGLADETPGLGDRYVRAQEVAAVADGLLLRFDSSWGAGEIRSGLLGRFNAENLLLTLGVLLAWDMPLEAALASLRELRPVPGRMNLLGGRGRPRVVVDFAHTPDALEQVLSSLREHVNGRLLCVFGCGGDRDRDKRPRMGGVAQRLADVVIVTDDNPRSEDGGRIVQDILAGMSESTTVEVGRDRARAITAAIAAAGPDDLVLVAGKGHEDYQLVGDMRIPFSDLEQARRALQEYAA
jgi:UDP-N-acetylmuramoyl-L-alanyl-D-glutamate--2,6-diaminopimelate ligase